jgi:glutamate/tyrosine decarboxylase-like PLP-dependent enzyme
MTEKVINTTAILREGIESIPGFRILGKPVMSVFSFTSDRHDIYRWVTIMQKGVEPRQAPVPAALHIQSQT